MKYHLGNQPFDMATSFTLIILFTSFSYQHKLMVSHWCLRDNKSPKVSQTLLSILVNLGNAIVWMVSTHPLISMTSSSCTDPLVTVPRAPITTGITTTFMFQSFFQSPDTYLSFSFLSILLCALLGLQSSQFGKFVFFFFLLTIIRSVNLAEIW